MKSLYDGAIEMSEEFVDEMYFCLDCQACQTACPAGVQYGELVEDARHRIHEHRKEPFTLRLVKSAALYALSSRRITKFIARLIRLYQLSGLYEAVEKSAVLNLFPHRLNEQHAMLPTITDDFFDERAPEFVPSEGQRRGRVAFLSGCIMNVAFSQVHEDVIAVLSRNGFEVVIPRMQVCCGSLHAHNGDKRKAKELARKNIDAFDAFQADAIVVDSAGCSAFLKQYANLLYDDAVYMEKAIQLSEKVKDVTEFLDAVGFITPEKPLNKRVTYHDACHLVHTQKIMMQPRRILQSIPGIEFVELPEATWCCGSAGIYNIVRYEDSMKLLERKMTNIGKTEADIVVTANPGCYLQLQSGIKKFGLKMEVMHPASLLNAAYG